MTASNPSLTWELLDTVFYRSRNCYESIEWTQNDNDIRPFNLTDYNVSIGPYASLIAIYPKFLSRLSTSEEIAIFSGSGQQLFKIFWNFSLNPIVNIGWSNVGELIVVLASGKYRVYYNYEGDFEEYDLFADHLYIEIPDETETDSDPLIINAKFTKFGFAIQTSNNNFLYIQQPRKPSDSTIIKCSQLKTIDPIEPFHVTSWTISSPPDCTKNSLNSVKFFIFTSAGICTLANSTTYPVFKHESLLTSISHVDIAPNNNFASVYSSSLSKLYIFDGEFNNMFVQQEIEISPNEIAWCSNDVVVLSYSDYISVIGPSTDKLNFYTDGKAYLHGEINGLYYLTNSELNFLSRVSDITEKTFKIGSTSPSAILLDAIDFLDKHSPKANDHLEIIDNQLVLAVDGCIRAASEEFDIYWQKNLLRAANFGKVNLDLYDPVEFVQTCDYLRVLNIIRSPEIGIFITYDALHDLGIDFLIDMLLLRQMHYLCLKICDFLSLPNYKILTDWASCKLKYLHDINDDELLSVIVNKLENHKIDWTHLAKIAYTEGRGKLARNFLSYEPNTSKKVEFLLDINVDTRGDEIEFALTKADEDGDVDSLVLILLEMYQSLTGAEFFKALNNKPNAVGILKSAVCQIDDSSSKSNNMLRNFLYQDDDVIGLLVFDLLAMTNSNEIDPKQLTKIQALANRSKYTQYIAHDLNLTSKLLKVQDEMKVSFSNIVSGEPIMKTIEKIISKDIKQAHGLSRKFNVAQFQFASCVLKTLACKPEKHAELYEYATSGGGGKILGFESFFYELIKLGEQRQAGMYLSLCNDMNFKQKIRSYIQCGMWKEAVTEAGIKNDLQLLRAMKNGRDGWEAKVVNDEIERITGKKV